MRHVILDTETTGLDPAQGHRIIEIGALEMVNRKLTGRQFHHYINPERDSDPQAIKIHGLTNDFLREKPVILTLLDSFLDFIHDAELIIHNAKFDMGFIRAELKRAHKKLDDVPVIDTLELARQKHPGQKNNLDALCKRYSIDNSKRDLHGALMDAKLLALVYLAMTAGGQKSLLDIPSDNAQANLNSNNFNSNTTNNTKKNRVLKIIPASLQEEAEHNAKLEAIHKNYHQCLWQEQESNK